MGTGSLLPPLNPGDRIPLGYDEWLISQDEAEYLRSSGGTATVNGVPVPVYFIERWDHVHGELVHVTGSGS